MSLKSLSFLFLTLSILVSFVSAAYNGERVGGWTPVDNPNDPYVIEIAKFAVAEYNKKAGVALTFASVVRAETQVVAGTNYKLVIAAKASGSTLENKYEAIVWDKPWEKFRELFSFKEIKDSNDMQ